MKPEFVTAVIVTRGGMDLAPVLATLASFREVLVWDNSAPSSFRLSDRQDQKVYGRYLGAMEAFEERVRSKSGGKLLPFVLYVQDDDCVTDPSRIVAEYGSADYESRTVLCNMPEAFRPGYADGVALVGFGAVFEIELIMPAFEKYLLKFPLDDFFRTECDRIFTKLNRLRFVDVPVDRLPCSWDAHRLWRRDGHAAALDEVRRRLKGLEA